MSPISAECFILQWLGHCQGDLIYSPWHFRWHSFHLDVILHDINSDLAARINIAVLFWETSREQTSWTLLHNLHYPAAQRIKRKKNVTIFFRSAQMRLPHVCDVLWRMFCSLLTEQLLSYGGLGHNFGYHSSLYSLCSRCCSPIVCLYGSRRV